MAPSISENVPFGQFWQEVDLLLELNCPELQRRQAVAAELLNSPGGHGVHDPAPCVETSPEGQLVQDADPETEYLPASHG